MKAHIIKIIGSDGIAYTVPRDVLSAEGQALADRDAVVWEDGVPRYFEYSAGTANLPFPDPATVGADDRTPYAIAVRRSKERLQRLRGRKRLSGGQREAVVDEVQELWNRPE